MSRTMRGSSDEREDPAVLAARDAERLAEVVERLAELGWSVHGGIAYKVGAPELRGHDSDHLLAQAEGYEARMALRKVTPAPTVAVARGSDPVDPVPSRKVRVNPS